jgi:hypothetical protein
MAQKDQAAQSSAAVAGAYDGHRLPTRHVRSGPDTQTRILSHVVVGGATRPSAGHGEKITDNGITNNVWIVLSLRGGDTGFVSAVYLKGRRKGWLAFLR